MGLFNYLKKDIWRIRIEDLPKRRAFKIRIYRVFMLILQGFTKRQVQQGASALTYYTLLSIVPILALLFGIAKGLLLQEGFRDWLAKQFAGQQIVVAKLIEFSQMAIKKTDKGVIAGIGIALVAWSAIRMLIYVEFVMNRIWEVRKKRTLSKRVTDYLAILGFCPALLAVSIGLTAYVSTVISDIGKEAGLLDKFGPILFPFLNFLPIVVSWVFLTFLYVFIPNTYVKLRPAFYAAVITGSIYQGLSWIYFYLQIGVSHYNEVYGTFAALPLFLIWVHFSWIIVLIGAKIAFAFQNVKAFEFISEDVRVSHNIYLIICIRVSHLCVKYFVHRQPPPTLMELSNKLVIPLKLVRDVLYRLVDAGVLLEVNQEGERHASYVPAIPEDLLTIKCVIDMIDGHGVTIPLVESPDTDKIIESMEGFSEMIEKSDYNLLLKEIE